MVQSITNSFISVLGCVHSFLSNTEDPVLPGGFWSLWGKDWRFQGSFIVVEYNDIPVDADVIALIIQSSNGSSRRDLTPPGLCGYCT